jgi:hypothetical protein
MDPENRETDRLADSRAARDAVSDSNARAKEAGRRADASERTNVGGGAPAVAPTAPLEQKPAPLTEQVTAGADLRRERAEESRVGAAAPAPLAMAKQVAIPGPDFLVSPDPAVRWRIVNGSSVERSLNAGASWAVVWSVTGSRLIAGYAPSSSVVWVVGRGIHVTTDGTRFEPVPFPENVDLVSVLAVDDRQATVTTVDGRRFTTTNRGQSWDLR